MEKREIVWTEEQNAILDWFATGQGNAMVQAGAGCGKTTTIIEGLLRAPEQKKLYCVFATRNKEEAEQRIPNAEQKGISIKTLNALGYFLVRQFWPKSRPDDRVEYERIRRVVGWKVDNEVVQTIYSLVGFAKNTLQMPTIEELVDLAQERMLEATDLGWNETRLAEAALGAMKLACEPDPQNRISFNDQIWLPIVMKWTKPLFPLVVVDETQDMNLAQLLMVIAVCLPTGRIGVVGDDNQAIYYFRGAASGGMDFMREKLSAKVFGLMTTQRCPQVVVGEAARLVPGYKAAENAPLGLLDTISAREIEKHAKLGDVILSRLNAPLMPLCLSFIKQGIPAKVEGKDIAKGLVALVKRLKATSVDDFLTKLNDWESKQIARALKSQDGDKKADLIADQAEVLRSIASDTSMNTVNDIITRIESIFDKINGDKGKLITLSSTHKAKGLEWNRVFALKSTFMRPAFAGNAKTAKEEKNLLYVAITRAKNHLTYVV